MGSSSFWSSRLECCTTNQIAVAAIWPIFLVSGYSLFFTLCRFTLSVCSALCASRLI